MQLPWADTHPLFLVFQVIELMENKLIQATHTLLNVAVNCNDIQYISVAYNTAIYSF